MDQARRVDSDLQVRFLAYNPAFGLYPQLAGPWWGERRVRGVTPFEAQPHKPRLPEKEGARREGSSPGQRRGMCGLKPLLLSKGI